MKKTFFLLIPLAALAVLFLTSGYIFSEDKGWEGLGAPDKEDTAVAGRPFEGQFTYIKGDVIKKNIAEPGWLTAAVNSIVKSGDKVKTMEATRAEINFGLTEIIRVASNTTIDVLKLVREKEKKTTSISVEEGDIWGNIAKLDVKDGFEIATPMATASIRGTKFRINASQKKTEVKVYEGQVEVYRALGRKKYEGERKDFGGVKEVKGPSEVPPPVKEVTVDEWRMVIKKNQKIVLSQGQPLPEAEDFNDTDQDEASEWVKWNKERDEALKKPAK